MVSFILLPINAAEAQQNIVPEASAPNSTTGTAMTANSTNATANATGTAAGGGPLITNMTWYRDVNFNPLNIQASGPENFQNVSEPLSPTNIEYQKTDAAFAKLAQTTYDCLQDYNQIVRNQISFREENAAELAENPGFGTGLTAEDINRQDLCTDTVSQGIMYFCDASDFATYDMTKCAEARAMSETYLGVAEAFYG